MIRSNAPTSSASTNILDGTGGTAVMNIEVRKTAARRKVRVQLETFQTQAATPDS